MSESNKLTAGLKLDCDGAELITSAVTPEALANLDHLFAALDARPGHRIYRSPPLADWIGASGLLDLAATRVGGSVKPVRATLFDKSSDANWSLGWHQDRTIAVRERLETPGFARWGRKAGIAHVEPPYALLARMVTMRIHLDPVTADNAPLLIAPGSHRLGKIAEAEIDEYVRKCGRITCLADTGDIWLYRTPIVHASANSNSNARRRVLQVDFSADTLPLPLEWRGIA